MAGVREGSPVLPSTGLDVGIINLARPTSFYLPCSMFDLGKGEAGHQGISTLIPSVPLSPPGRKPTLTAAVTKTIEATGGGGGHPGDCRPCHCVTAEQASALSPRKGGPEAGSHPPHPW